MVSIARPTVADLDDLMADLRPADRVECEALGIPDWQQQFARDALDARLGWTARTAKGQLIAVFGATRHETGGGVGAPWMLATPALDQHRRSLVRIVPFYLAIMLDTFRVLENWVHAGNAKSIRWLRRIGFTIHPAGPHGAQGARFHRFDMVRP